MGKQYNFYISPKQDLEFIKYLFDEGYMIVVPHAYWEGDIIKYDHGFNNVEIYDKQNYFMNVQEMHYSFKIYRKIWGELVKKQQGFLDYEKSPLIEYRRCFINKEENFLSGGRLYLDTDYKEEKDSFEIICKEYQKLVRVIKKYIAYKDYIFDDGQCLSRPSSQEVVDLVRLGYHII